MDGEKDDKKLVGVRSDDTEETVRRRQIKSEDAEKSHLLIHRYICDSYICKASKCINL